MRMLNPARQVSELGDLLFGKAASATSFPEASLSAIAVHQLWAERCECVFQGKRFRARRILRRIEAAFRLHVKVYTRAMGKKIGRGGGLKGHGRIHALAEQEASLLGRIRCRAVRDFVSDRFLTSTSCSFAFNHHDPIKYHVMASSLPPAPESLVDNLPPVSPTAAIKAAVVRITAAATGGAVLGGALGFGLGFVAREGTKVTMRESAFGLKTVAIMSAVYAATTAAIENLRNDLLDSAKPGLAGCAAGLAASVP
ncbi:unnamed protein product, partial [Closterium sp. NIES-65]